MTSTTATAQNTQSACVGVINARDFNNNTRDPLRDRWTVGTLHHVVKVLAGRPVAVTVDKSTGHTLFNVTLEVAYDGGNGPRLRVTYDCGSRVNVTDYSVDNVGVIMTMPTDGVDRVKWDALESHRNHCSAAIDIARKAKDAKSCQWGVWSATVRSGGTVYVRYTPSTGNPHFADRWGKPGLWTVSVEG
jgi:hypothetical protein